MPPLEPFRIGIGIFGKIDCLAENIKQAPVLGLAGKAVGYFKQFLGILAFQIRHRTNPDIAQITGDAFAHSGNRPQIAFRNFSTCYLSHSFCVSAGKCGPSIL